ncbi:hypothetical protein MSAN_01996100 [Mycena sanguinolenta]|uniref:Uncharacterized protein n=1 Tax=Mycena sanguinolenta TaxID=230812 RepID=A0A8H7CM44_9AGAR|nr:hypothetical protein MSAN_01996100 [Mycena sanguinolenta]
MGEVVCGPKAAQRLQAPALVSVAFLTLAFNDELRLVLIAFSFASFVTSSPPPCTSGLYLTPAALLLPNEILDAVRIRLGHLRHRSISQSWTWSSSTRTVTACSAAYAVTPPPHIPMGRVPSHSDSIPCSLAPGLPQTPRYRSYRVLTASFVTLVTNLDLTSAYSTEIFDAPRAPHTFRHPRPSSIRISLSIRPSDCRGREMRSRQRAAQGLCDHSRGQYTRDARDVDTGLSADEVALAPEPPPLFAEPPLAR